MSTQLTRRQKRYKAKRLFFKGGLTAIEISKMVGVTQATMSKWVKRFGWKNPDTAGFCPKTNVTGIISPAFAEYLQNENPALLKSIYDEIKSFIGVSKQPAYSISGDIKALFKALEIDEFYNITIEQVDGLTALKAKKLLFMLQEYAKPPIELIIKSK